LATDINAAMDPAPHNYARYRVIPPRVVSDVPRVDPSVIEQLASCSVPDLVDAVGPFQAMSPAIRPLDAGMPRAVGSALTVRAVPGDNLTIHGALVMAGEGDVLVIDWCGFFDACGTGGQSLLMPISRGLRGIVIDGCWRDIGELRTLRIPIFGRGVSPVSPPKASVGDINVPAVCGGVIVDPGDVVVADEEGIVVVPRAHAHTVAERVLARQRERELAPVDLEAEEQYRARRFATALDAVGGTRVVARGSHDGSGNQIIRGGT
jgi:regulator of RNase E activity RraA